jgi:hypothetical protein
MFIWHLFYDINCAVPDKLNYFASFFHLMFFLSIYDIDFRIDYRYLLLKTLSTLTSENKALTLYSLDTLSFIRL